MAEQLALFPEAPGTCERCSGLGMVEQRTPCANCCEHVSDGSIHCARCRIILLEVLYESEPEEGWLNRLEKV